MSKTFQPFSCSAIYGKPLARYDTHQTFQKLTRNMRSFIVYEIITVRIGRCNFNKMAIFKCRATWLFNSRNGCLSMEILSDRYLAPGGVIFYNKTEGLVVHPLILISSRSPSDASSSPSSGRGRRFPRLITLFRETDAVWNIRSDVSIPYFTR